MKPENNYFIILFFLRTIIFTIPTCDGEMSPQGEALETMETEMPLPTLQTTQSGAQPTNNTNVPAWFDQITLLDVVKMGDLEAVKYRVSVAGDNVTIANNYPSDYALFQSASKELPILKYLVEEAGVPINPPNQLGDTLLHLGAKSCNLDVIGYAIEKGAGVSSRDARGRTPLFVAASSNCVKGLEYLLGKGGAELMNETDTRNGNSPLHAAAIKHNIQSLSFLLGRGARLEAKNGNGATPLQAAIRENTARGADAVRYLIARGADVRTGDGNGDTLLHAAVLQQVGLPLVKTLVEAGVEPNVRNRDDFTALELIAIGDGLSGSNAESPVHKYLLQVERNNVPAGELITTTTEAAPSPPALLEYKYISLLEAIESGNVDAFRFRVSSAGDNVSSIVANSLNALLFACQSGALPIVKYLVEEVGVDVNSQSDKASLLRSPLHISAGLQSTELLRYLVAKGGNVNSVAQFGARPLHDAATHGIYLEPVEYLVSAGADINASLGHSALHKTTIGPSPAVHIPYFLVEHGAALNDSDRNGDTFLALVVHAANKYSKPPVPLIKFLVGKGADIQTRNNKGMSLLHHAASSMSLQVFKFLIGSGELDVNARDKVGNTPLHLVVPFHSQPNQVDVIQILVESGAQTNVTNSRGTKPIDLYRGGNEEARRLLTPPAK